MMLDCITSGFVLFPVAVRSNRQVAPSTNPIKAEVVKPNAPRVTRTGLWSIIEPLGNRIINRILNCLPRFAVEYKVAGYMDSLIEAIICAKDSEGEKEVKRIIQDIGTLTSELNCAKIFNNHIQAKAKSLSREQFLSCCKFLDRLDEKHSAQNFVVDIKKCFSLYKKNDEAIRAFFETVFCIQKNTYPDLTPRITEVLSHPARTIDFPEKYVALKELAQDIVKKMDEAELEEINSVKVTAYPEGSHRDWVVKCVEAAKEEKVARQTQKKEILKNKCGGGILNIAKNIAAVAQEDPDMGIVRDGKIMDCLPSLVMQMAQKINMGQLVSKIVLQDVIDDLLNDNPEVKKAVQERASERVGDRSSWGNEIKNEIDSLNQSQVGKGKSVFDFNPKKVKDPIDPKTLVDLIFDASLR